MADLGTILGEGGVILTGIGVLWKFVLVRPLEKAEMREERLQKRVDELTEVIKDAAEEKRHRLSLPPPRAELPTLDAIKVLGYDPEEEERRRQKPLNPGRMDGVDHMLSTYVADVSSTPPRSFPKPRKR